VKIDPKVWRPRIAYGAFTLLAFLLALRFTFPADAVKQRLVLEAAARGWTIEAAEVAPGGLLGVEAEGVTVEDRSGLKVPVDELTASLRLLPLLTGKRSVAFEARLYEGEVSGIADLSGSSRRLALDVEGVDLARVLPLRKASRLDLLGKVHGTADLVVDATGNERPTGRIDLTVREAGVAGGQLPVPGMATGLTVPRIGLGEVTAAVRLDGGKATFERLDAKGGDAELTGEDLSVALQPRPAFSPVSGRVKLRVQDAFWGRGGNAGLRGITEAALQSSRGGDGAWNFQLSGTLAAPQLRPVPPA
jgi:type II secretion system protein N